MKILLIEDEFHLATELSKTLESEGYEVVCVVDTGQDAYNYYEKSIVDLVLCDINIQGHWDGIETVEQLLAIQEVPIIYLTAITDNETIQRANKTSPAAFITKPYHVTDLRLAIELAILHFAERVHPKFILKENKANFVQKEAILQVKDDIFIKQNYQFVKFPLGDILYLEAEKMYTSIVTAHKKYAIRETITLVLDRLPLKQLVRIHRSYAVNINKIESFNEREVTINGYQIPLSRTFKDDYMKHFLLR